ncbi:MAG: hypothetical protein Ct9H300mP1_27320 [Planctomycetaceae bacterium]|nr:MAG: hypothetical protein Ct9H300mP1_27320 [Planctomycetaceae bacterium]
MLSGDDSLTLPCWHRWPGVVSVVGNIIPDDVKAMLVAFDNGELTEAQQWHADCSPSAETCSAWPPIHPDQGRDGPLGGTPGRRLPMTPLASGELAELKTTLTGYGLLSATG